MALPSSGVITLAMIQAEFGGANPISLSEYYKGGAYVSAMDVAPNVPSSGTITLSQFRDAFKNVAGQLQWTTVGIYSFVVPGGVTSISAVTIGSGGSGGGRSGSAATAGGGGGGGLSYSNGISVTPGETLTVTVSGGGNYVNNSNSDGNPGGACSIKRGADVLLSAAGGAKGTYDGASAAYGGSAGAGVGSIRYSGGRGGTSDSSYVYSHGGGSGRYTSEGAWGSGGNSIPANSASLFGENTGTTLGHGGAGVSSGQSGAGFAGGVRIMWGVGRAYPSPAADV